jgi:hypothetical protein
MTVGVFTYREPAKIVADIIQQAMGLTAGQVMLSNQKNFIPIAGPLIVLSYIGPSKVISNVDEWTDVGGVFTEIQSVTMQHLLQIDIMSYDSSARTRKDEIIFAIRSLLSEAQQELYQMNIARQPGPFLDTSFLEETKRVTCYTTTLATVSVNQKSQPVGDYYVDFSRAVPPQIVVNQ